MKIAVPDVISIHEMKSGLLQALFDDIEQLPLSVSELNAQVKGEIERRFMNVWEIGRAHV